jgi:hypothetical protein
VSLKLSARPGTGTRRIRSKKRKEKRPIKITWPSDVKRLAEREFKREFRLEYSLIFLFIIISVNGKSQGDCRKDLKIKVLNASLD